MPFLILHDDITTIRCGAIVNAANRTLLGGGGVDGAIQDAAGPALLAECRTLGGCETGEAKLTGGYELPCRYVIHTVGPIWQGGGENEEALLRACYRNSLALARKKKLRSVAFPLISAGVYGYPKAAAMRVAREEIAAFLAENDMTVMLVIFDPAVAAEEKQMLAPVQTYLDAHWEPPAPERPSFSFRSPTKEKLSRSIGVAPLAAPEHPADACASSGSPTPLETLLSQLDESFSQMLLRKIDEKGMTDAQCYKRANIDRKLFSKIRSDRDYRPSKQTAVAFAVALELNEAETRELLGKAGFVLTHSRKFDVIIEYFIRKGVYDIHEINEALFAFDQSLLGA